MCDSCGTVRSRSAARPEGWLSVRTLADLSHVVPDSHPLHHERHLCSVECLQDFSQTAVDGGVVPMDVDAGPVEAITSRVTSIRSRRPALPDKSVPAAVSVAKPQEVPAVSASESSTEADLDIPAEAEGRPPAAAGVTRLSDIIAEKLARGDGGQVDLRKIAEKPAVRRRIR